MELQEPSPNNNNNISNNLTHQILDLNEAVLTPEKSPPFFVLSFTNLTYSVKTTGKLKIPLFSRQKNEDKSPDTKVLLNEISGEAREGEITAVLGASGSGKSTLIDALAARISKESLRGTVTLNGDVLESKHLKILSAYVMQDDLLFPMLTVEETLMFSAEFRLPRSMTSSKKKARVQALIDQLGLRSAAKTVIGDEGHRGISGGERRRVSIGVDIIHDPILLYLDEPTSGLDSSSAFMVAKVLKRIAQSGSIVITSLHQPSYRVMNLLDQLIVLSRGQSVFCGPPATLSRYFVQFGHPIPNNENPTEFTLDLIRELEVSANGIKLLAEFNKAWQRRNNYDNALNNNISIMKSPLKKAMNVDMLKTTENTVPRFANPFWTDVLVISKRSLKNSWRMPELFGVRVMATVITSIILATIYWKLDDSPRGVQERIAFFAFAMTSIFYTCAESIPIFLQERYIFMRETAYNTYRRSSYVLAHAIVALPSLLFLSFLFAVITFWCIGLSRGFSGFLYYFLLISASFWAGSSFVTFLSGVVANLMLAYTVVVAMLAYFLLFSGFFINRDRIPWYWLWFHYVSLVKYSYEGVLQNEFGDATKCFATGIQIFDNSPLATVSDAMKLKLLKDMSMSLGTDITGSTCLSTGLDILNQQAVTDISKWNCLWITVAWGFFFRILFYFSLLLGSKNKRR